MNPTTIPLLEDFYQIPDRPTTQLFASYGHWHPVYITRLTYSVLLCNKYRSRIFVFGDNLERTGVGGQAIIRNCENSFGLRTKKEPTKVPGAYFTDRDYTWFCRIVDYDLINLKDLNKQYPIVLSANGYGTGLAKLPTQAPKCYTYLCKQLNEFCHSPIFNPYYGTN